MQSLPVLIYFYLIMSSPLCEAERGGGVSSFDSEWWIFGDYSLVTFGSSVVIPGEVPAKAEQTSCKSFRLTRGFVFY